MIQPDYQGGSIVNLMRSIGDACGAAPLAYAPLRGLDGASLGAARNIVLLVVNGLGFNHLQASRPGGALHGHLHSRLTSVFPSTTASAITTFLTGLAPQQHALTGWYMYFQEIDSIAAVLPLEPRGEGRYAAEPGELPRQLFGYASFFDRIARRAVVVSPHYLAESEFSTYHAGGAEIRAYRRLEDLFAQVEATVREENGATFVYAYYPSIDALSHLHGVRSAEVASRLAALDGAFEGFLESIRSTDTLVLVTADHGFIDAPAAHLIELDRHPRFAQLLARPLCGERRAAYCYVKPQCTMDFEAYVRDNFSESADLFRSRDLIAQGWFGVGTPAPRLAERVGDYTLLMKSDWTIKDWMPGEKRHAQIGQHGGVSADEMYVPLILAAPGS